MVDLIDSLDEYQREVATTLNGPVCVLAGAGSGKTRAMTHRIAYGVQVGAYRPAQVLALSFTVKAAGEMKERLKKLGCFGVQTSTFHSAAYRQLNYYWPKVLSSSVPNLLTTRERFIAELVKDKVISPSLVKMSGMNSQNFSFNLAAELGWAKVRLVPIDNYAKFAEDNHRSILSSLPAEAVEQVLQLIEQYKAQKKLIDFDDCLTIMTFLIRQNHDIASEIASYYRHFVVDEYQDVSPLQQYLLDLWLGERDNLCVVGDPAQTIYSFSGGSDFFIRSFTNAYKNAKIIKLECNYRSHKEIVDLANKVMEKSPRPSGLVLHAVNHGETMPKSPARFPNSIVNFTSYESDAAEAELIAQNIKSIKRRGESFSETAVLFRRNIDSLLLKDAFELYQIPYVLSGQTAFFDQAKVKTIIRDINVRALDFKVSKIDKDHDVQVELIKILQKNDFKKSERNVQKRIIPQTFLQLLSLANDEWVKKIPQNTPGETCQKFTLNDFGEYLARLIEIKAQPQIDAVTLSTLHSAKGLEWDRVFLAGVYQGLLPLNTIDFTNIDDLEEERRLLYVGITRARKQLYVSYAFGKHASARSKRRKSQFLDFAKFQKFA